MENISYNSNEHARIKATDDNFFKYFNDKEKYKDALKQMIEIHDVDKNDDLYNDIYKDIKDKNINQIGNVNRIILDLQNVKNGRDPKYFNSKKQANNSIAGNILQAIERTNKPKINPDKPITSTTNVIQNLKTKSNIVTESKVIQRLEEYIQQNKIKYDELIPTLVKKLNVKVSDIKDDELIKNELIIRNNLKRDVLNKLIQEGGEVKLEEEVISMGDIEDEKLVSEDLDIKLAEQLSKKLQPNNISNITNNFFNSNIIKNNNIKEKIDKTTKTNIKDEITKAPKSKLMEVLDFFKDNISTIGKLLLGLLGALSALAILGILITIIGLLIKGYSIADAIDLIKNIIPILKYV